MGFRSSLSTSTRQLFTRVVKVTLGISESGLVILTPIPGKIVRIIGYIAVVESAEVEMALKFRGAEIAGSKATIKAAEATEANPHEVLLAEPITVEHAGELVALSKGIGGEPFINFTAIVSIS